MSRLSPIAPGAYIIEELSARGRTIADLQTFLKVPDATMFCLLDGRFSITPYALDLARYFKTSTAIWRRLQRAFDWWSEEDDEK